jgi:hypothetical protein
MLAAQLRDNLSVYFLSGAESLPPHLIEHLVESGVRLILSPRDSAMCTELVDGLEPYSLLNPHQVLGGSPETLMGVWLKDESYA